MLTFGGLFVNLQGKRCIQPVMNGYSLQDCFCSGQSKFQDFLARLLIPYSEGSTLNSLRKKRAKYLGLLKPTS